MLVLAGIALAAAIVAAVAVIWLRRQFVLVTIHGSSMLPTFRTGDRVLVRRTPLPAIREGEVVVVEQPILGLPRELAQRAPAAGGGLDRGWMIKRAAAVPGFPIPAVLAEALGAEPGATVPPGHLAVLGDNTRASFDSRLCGYLTESQVLGVAVRSVSRAREQPSPVDPASLPGDLECRGE